MNVTLTLVGQMLTFLVLVWFVMKFLWIPVLKVLEDRQKKIADGLSAAEEGMQSREKAEIEIASLMKEARERANRGNRASPEVEEMRLLTSPKWWPSAEGEHLLNAARSKGFATDELTSSSREFDNNGSGFHHRHWGNSFYGSLHA